MCMAIKIDSSIIGPTQMPAARGGAEGAGICEGPKKIAPICQMQQWTSYGIHPSQIRNMYLHGDMLRSISWLYSHEILRNETQIQTTIHTAVSVDAKNTATTITWDWA